MSDRTPSPDEEALLSRLRSDNEDDARAALEQIFRTHYDSLIRFADSYVRSPAMAQDVVSSLFAWLWERRLTVRITNGIITYLHAAVRHRAHDHLRRTRVERHWQDAFASAGESPASGAGEGDSALLADERLEHDDQLRALAAAVAALPERTRTILWMRWRSGLTAAQIAEATGRTPAAVAMELSRTLTALRATLGPLLSLLLVVKEFC